MAVAGIIAEYNPFHRGHAWQIGEIRRRLGPDTAVAVCMSGNFVQRGDFAIAGKHARAEMALRGGADLVLELPAPWSAATAERFAQGGAAVLAATGVVDCLVFGSECADLTALRAVADCLDSQAYSAGLRSFIGAGMPFAAARQAAARALVGAAADCLSQPNDTLAVEYLRALKALKTGLRPMALPRTGAGHHGAARGEYSSAGALRAMVLAGEDWRPYMPEEAAAILDREIGRGRAPVSGKICERAVLARLRSMEEEEFRPYDGGGEGLYHRFYNAVRRGTTVEEILAAAKTRRYPLSRLRRMLLYSYLGQPQAPRGETPCYLRVLGATARGRELLADMRHSSSLPVVIKPGRVGKLGERVEKAFAREARHTDLYALAYPELGQAAPESDYTASPVML